jgi:prophage DNA circulation protein
MDEWQELLFEASYGGIPIDVVTTEDDVSRVLARHEYPFQDGAVLQDMGAAPRTTQCDVIFIPTVGQEDNHINRLTLFLTLLNEAHKLDEPPILVHPLTGSYPALPEGISISAGADARDFIRVSLTFVESGLDPAAFETVGDESVGAGVAEVSIAGGEVDAALAAPDLPDPIYSNPTVQADSLITAERWRDTIGITPREITLELNRIANRISDETEAMEVLTNVDRYPVYLAFLRLHAAIRRAAELAIQTRPKLTEITLARTEPLIAIMTRIYGGRRAMDFYTRTRELNDISNPARIPAGTKLTIEQP